MGNTQKLGTLVNGLTVDTSGNVVIGKSTITSGANFEVYNATQANLYISSSGTNESVLRFFSGGNELVTLRSTGTGALRIETGTGSPSERMRITSTGLVGIGTATPSTTLHISTTNGIRLQYPGNTGYTQFSTDGNNAYIFSGYDGERMRITSAGAVGIGTTSPFNRLTIQSSGSYGLLTLGDNWASDTWTGIKIGAAADSGLAGIDIRSYSYYASSSATSMAIFTNSTSNTLTERLRITTDGTLNLGTYHSPVKFLPGADSNHYLRYNTSLDGLELSGYSGVMFSTLGGTERMRVTTGGNVLIGQSTADLATNGWQLLAGGGGHTAFAINNNEAFIFNNRNTGTTYEIDFRTNAVERGKISVTDSGVSYVTTSDYRVKEDFKEINGLEKVSSIKVYDFKFKDMDLRADGVIAHELQEVLPYAVTGEKDGRKFQGVDYSKIVPVLVKAIQELKAEIDILKNK